MPLKHMSFQLQPQTLVMELNDAIQKQRPLVINVQQPDREFKLQLWVAKYKQTYLIDDNGMTMDKHINHDSKLEQQYGKWFLAVLEKYQVNHPDDRLVVHGTVDDIYQRIEALIECMLTIRNFNQHQVLI